MNLGPRDFVIFLRHPAAANVTKNLQDWQKCFLSWPAQETWLSPVEHPSKKMGNKPHWWFAYKMCLAFYLLSWLKGSFCSYYTGENELPQMVPGGFVVWCLAPMTVVTSMSNRLCNNCSTRVSKGKERHEGETKTHENLKIMFQFLGERRQWKIYHCSFHSHIFWISTVNYWLQIKQIINK